jgi:hypothetical protein
VNFKEDTMLRTKKAKKILTKKEQKHLTESGINSIEGMKRQVVLMKKQDNNCVCFECKHISKKLGLWS